jgi:hypothetical protein
MKGAVAAAAVALLAVGVLRASGGDSALPLVSPDLPPSPSTWPTYPKFSPHSCWGRPATSLRVMRFAPSPPVQGGSRVQPAELVRRALARLGDESAIKGIEIGPVPPRRMIRHRFPGKRPPPDGLWAYVSAPDASHATSPNRTPEFYRAARLALWEVALVFGALRDDFCGAGGPPLVGWTLVGGGLPEGGVSDDAFALNQSFPNPSPAGFRARVVDVGKRFGFQPVSIRLLRPRQLAPIVVVETDRDRREFMADVGEIVKLLNPYLSSRQQTAVTFEGFFFEARDSDGPFVRVTSSFRGAVVSGYWSAVPGFSRY